MQSQGSVEQYLHENESVETSVEVSSATVYVTNRRVLASTPSIEGKNFQQAERPNVTNVALGIDEDRSLLWNGAQYALLGGLLTPVGFIVDFGSIFGDLSFETEGAGQFGAGGLISAAETLITALTLLSYGFIALGVVMLLYGVLRLVQYQQGREETLELTVAGDGQNLSLPVPEEKENAKTRLEQAVFPEMGQPGPSAQQEPHSEDPIR